MKDHICKICNKLYSSKQSLCNHVKNIHKNIIQPLVTTDVTTNVTTDVMTVTTNVTNSVPIVTTKYSCKYCNKEFKRRQNKWTHETKYCKKEITNNDIIPTITKNKITNNTNNTNNGTINNNITINNYTNDNVDYVTEAFIKRMFNHLKYKNEHHLPIPKMIENIKFNSNHKENNNVKIKNMRSKVGLIYNDNKWLTVDKENLLNQLYKKAIDMLKNWSERDNFMTDEMKKDYECFNKMSQLVLKTDIKEEINKKAYIYTKNNDTPLDI